MFYSLYTSACWLSFTGVWALISLIKSPGLLSVFWPILIMQLSGLCSSSDFWIFQFFFRTHQIQWISPSPSCSKYFFEFTGKVKIFISLFVFFDFSLCGQPGQQSPFFGSWSACIPKFPENFVRLILQDEFWFVHIPLGGMINFSLFHNYQWIIFPSHSSLILYLLALIWWIRLLCDE